MVKVGTGSDEAGLLPVGRQRYAPHPGCLGMSFPCLPCNSAHLYPYFSIGIKTRVMCSRVCRGAAVAGEDQQAHRYGSVSPP